MKYLIYFFLGVQQRDFDGVNVTKWKKKNAFNSWRWEI